MDDDGDSRAAVAWFLKEQGHDLVECASAEEALEAYLAGDYPMLLSDIKLPGMSGIDLLKRLSAMPESWKTDVVLFTGFGDMQTAIEALRAGAYDYLLKPVDAQELDVVVQRIAEHQVLLRENKRLTSAFDDEVRAATEETQKELARIRRSYNDAVIGQIGAFSESTREIFKMACKYHTDRSIPVLIEGETGTGKEIIARIIHYGNTGTDVTAPFVDINCAAMAPTLMESELFGYEPGAFTGSVAKGQKGKLDAAAGGTLFLDEIGEMSPELQAKLLRVIQEKEYYRVGGIKKIKTDVRIICATNVDLEAKIRQGAFRRDLYYRLKVGHIILPALRLRAAEIVPLALMFLKDFANKRGKKFGSITPEASNALKRYAWPGNIRELKNTIEWIVFIFDDTALRPEYLEKALSQGQNAETDLSKNIDSETLTLQLPFPPGGFSLKDYTDEVVIQVLKANNGHQARTAEYLGISLRALGYRLEALKKKKNLQY